MNLNVERAFRNLGLESKATMDEAKRAFRRMAFRMHPDKNGSSRSSTEAFQELGRQFKIVESEIANRKHDGEDTDVLKKCDLDFLAASGCWLTVYSVSKGIGVDPGLATYAFSLLERNAEALMETKQMDMLDYVCMNAKSKSVSIAIIKWFQDMGYEDNAEAMVSKFADLGSWDFLARCAAGFERRRLGFLAFSLLEANACSVISSGHEEAVTLLWKMARLEPVRKMAMNEMAKAGAPEALREALDDMAQRNEWERMAEMACRIPRKQVDLRKHAVSLLEANLAAVLNGRNHNALLFMGSATASDRTRRTIVDWLVDAGDFEILKQLLARMSSEENWSGIARTYVQLPPGHAKLRNQAMALLEANLRAVASSGDADVLVFIYNKSETADIGARIFAALKGEGRFSLANHVLVAMAERRKWLEIKNEAESLANELAALKAYAVSLLEKHSRQVIASGCSDVIEFLCRHTKSDRIVTNALERAADADARAILDIMAKRSMWSEMNTGLKWFAAKPELRAYCLRLMETNIASIVQSGAGDVVLSIWEGTSTPALRQTMLEMLIAEGRKTSVMHILNGMAERRAWKSLRHCTEEVLKGRPDLRRHGLSLMEKNVASIVGSGNHSTMDFISKNTRRKDVLDVIHGNRREPGFYHKIVGTAKGAISWIPGI